jgi:hypothetical protein
MSLDLGPTDKYRQGLYVDLDSLFDTRFAILEEISPQLALDNLLNGWQTRQSDIPIGIPLEVFKDLYNVRTSETLSKANQTQVIELMKQWVEDIFKQTVSGTKKTIIRIFINVFPFILSETKAKLLGEKIKALFTPDVQFTLLNVDPKLLTPDTVKKYFAGMFMFDYHAWLEHHANEDNFKEIKLPDTSLYTPALFHNQKPSDVEMRPYIESKIDVFKEWEMYVSPLIGIEFLPIQVFSTQLPIESFTDPTKISPYLKKTSETSVFSK